MKIEHKNLEEQEMKIVPENPDDFWTIRNIVEEGDYVRALTFRSKEDSSDKIRPENKKKEPVELTIEVEEIEYQDFSGRLRVAGIIKEGKEDFIGRYHTINIEENKAILIKKQRWKKDQIERIEKAVEESDKPKVAILAIEEGEATIGVMKRHGLGKTTTLQEGSGKREGETGRRTDFFSEVNKRLKRTLKTNEIDKIVLAGPGFTKNDFYNFLKKSDQELTKDIFVEDTASVGERGIHEAIKRGAIEKIWKESRITDESRLMERLLKEIAKDGKATYGLEGVKKAVNLGAVEELLVSEKTLREDRKKDSQKVEELIDQTRQKGGEVKIFSSEFEPGEKLEALGGLAALLRFKISS
ncbi:mRNA surveillance protein pelota [archaeon SCG-AAA382B04]|nr:mRNA surveillance protein pelota [archaeon SCG-AAA382B04]